MTDIKKETFFYVMEDNYDEHVELSIPYYIELHNELLKFIPENKNLRVLDLGCGTGKTAYLILSKNRKCQIVGIDLFEEMLEKAKINLRKFENQVELIKGDFRTYPLPENMDLCVSALAIHHSTGAEKKALFKKIYDSLIPNGRFIMIDWIKFELEVLNTIAREDAENHIRQKNIPEHIINEWCEHWRTKNNPDTVENQQMWLHEAGFKYVECIYKYYGMTFLYAKK